MSELSALSARLGPLALVGKARADWLASRLSGEETPPLLRQGHRDRLHVAAYTANIAVATINGKPHWAWIING